MKAGIEKAKVQFFYDLQRLRIQTKGRITRAIEYDNAELTEEDRKFFDVTGESLDALEKHALKEADRVVSVSPIYPWLREQPGIGPTMAMVLVSQFCITDTREFLNIETGEIEIRKGAPRPSCFWSFAGLGVNENGRAPKREAGGEQKTSGKKGLPYNSWLRSKLIGVLGPSFLRAAKGEGHPKYRPIYDGLKHRLQHKGGCSLPKEKHGTGATWWPSGKKKAEPGDYCTDGHIHNQAMRYMVKMFLLDFWTEWRRVEGLPIVGPYGEDKLGLKHGG